MTATASVDLPITAQDVRAVVDALSVQGLDLCVLHGAERDGPWSGDVDVWTSAASGPALRAIRAAADRCGWRTVMSIQRLANTLEVELLLGPAVSHTVMFLTADDRLIHLDVAAGGGPIDTVQRDGLTAPSPGVEAAYLVLKRIRKRDRRPDSWAEISELARREPPALLDRFVSRSDAAELMLAAVEGVPPDARVVRRLRRRLVVRRRRSPIGLLRQTRDVVFGAAARVRRPGGVFVAMAGPDGTGKSTLAERLLDWSPYRATKHAHSRPGLLKPMGWYLGRSATPTGSEPHDRPAYGRTLSAARLLYYWCDFVLGYWLLIWPARARGRLVLVERWWWDMVVDPARHRIRPTRLSLLLGRLVPAPDVTLLLDADPLTVWARKQELELDELDRQRRAWWDLGAARVRLRAIDANQGPDAVFAAAVVEIVGARCGS